MALLEIQNLKKSFGGLIAVNDVSLKVEKGSISGLIGPNGAGKTTIFNLITGVIKVTSGHIEFDGKNIENLEPYKIAHAGITRTFQNIRLFKKLTVYENILTACHYNAEYSIAEAILFNSLPGFLKKETRFYKEEKELSEQAQLLMEILQLESRKNVTANNLPYGLQRRLEIARAMALNPKLLLLDEPAAGMNPDETERLAELIKYIRDKFGYTILLIEHHMDMVMQICESITVLNFGCKLSEGCPEEIQRNPKVQAAYLGGEGADEC